jgi:hypothetical protein
VHVAHGPIKHVSLPLLRNGLLVRILRGYRRHHASISAGGSTLPLTSMMTSHHLKRHVDTELVETVLFYCERYKMYSVIEKHPWMVGSEGVSSVKGLFRGAHAISTLALFAMIPSAVIGM